MIKGKDGFFMSYYTNNWARKPELLKGMRDKKKEIEKEIEFYTNFQSKGNEEILGTIIQNYKNQLIDLEKEYNYARKL